MFAVHQKGKKGVLSTKIEQRYLSPRKPDLRKLASPKESKRKVFV